MMHTWKNNLWQMMLHSSMTRRGWLDAAQECSSFRIQGRDFLFWACRKCVTIKAVINYSIGFSTWSDYKERKKWQSLLLRETLMARGKTTGTKRTNSCKIHLKNDAYSKTNSCTECIVHIGLRSCLITRINKTTPPGNWWCNLPDTLQNCSL
jgi:hypothetical protein